MTSNLLKKSFLALLILTVFTVSRCKENALVSAKEDEEYELELLMHEIKSMSAQVSCENAGDWKFVPIGNRGCGGAEGFVAYSTKIDTTYFLKKVAQYTDLQTAFNKKWQIKSPCNIIIAPKSIECVEGKAMFVY